jgi:hypothetical protein
MGVPAIYIEPEAPNTEVPCFVRIHSKWDALGDVAGTAFGYAEQEERIPEIVFDRTEVLPARHGIVSVETGEAYLVDHVLPRDLEWQRARVSVLSDEDTVGLPVPVVA